jgi:hypothetical protein
MERPRHGIEVHDAGGALQGVDGPERAVEAPAVAGRLLEGEKVAGGALDELARLDEELLHELVHAGSPQSMAA